MAFVFLGSLLGTALMLPHIHTVFKFTVHVKLEVRGYGSNPSQFTTACEPDQLLSCLMAIFHSER